MKINAVSSQVYFPGDKNVKVTKTDVPKPNTDKLEISGLAKSMNTANSQKIVGIKEKVASGFYNSDAVINKVAEEILKEIRGE